MFDMPTYTVNQKITGWYRDDDKPYYYLVQYLIYVNNLISLC